MSISGEKATHAKIRVAQRPSLLPRRQLRNQHLHRSSRTRRAEPVRPASHPSARQARRRSRRGEAVLRRRVGRPVRRLWRTRRGRLVLRLCSQDARGRPVRGSVSVKHCKRFGRERDERKENARGGTQTQPTHRRTSQRRAAQCSPLPYLAPSPPSPSPSPSQPTHSPLHQEAHSENSIQATDDPLPSRPLHRLQQHHPRPPLLPPEPHQNRPTTEQRQAERATRATRSRGPKSSRGALPCWPGSAACPCRP